MTDNKAENGKPDSTVQQMTEQSDMPEIEDTEALESELDAQLEQLEAENADLKDKYLRLMAEMENLRRRTAKEVKDANVYGVTSFARDMLAVGDNLGRALEAIPAEVAEAAADSFKTLLEGVELTEREMLNALGKHGVTKIDPEGEKFDPNFHQAMFEIPNPDVPNGTVMKVMQSGYVIGERVLRPAMVGVAKGGPKIAKVETPLQAVDPMPGSGPESAHESGPEGTSEYEQSPSDAPEGDAGAHVNKTA